VCERIPYLILPVRQLSREPFGIRRSAASEPPGKTPSSSQSNHPPKRHTSEPSGKPPGPPRTTRRSDTSEPSGKMPGPSQSERSAEAPRASRRAIRRARLDPNHPPKRYTSDPSSKPLPRSRVRSGAQAAASGRRRYRTEPLRLFAVNPLTVGELGRRVIGEVILV